ncbi:SDR family NAD(P)-dependent oxidoreductase [Bogoriella caseilytica]|uniref:Short-subunit dehydrogenase n=1 Tax=Bogoriella caseilytica TaxID=56055 RepID=A0A3N2BB76_9MICO|nr:SDR family NAD(P)-dependent oxidoreductase [Bogoriella caseilytica]ROR72507.1 short-subunit dehydrogenase [Bogoriella caseilytica]
MRQKWTAAELPDLTGSTFIVTGATAGLGEVTTRELARAGARVVMAVRDEAKASRVVHGIGQTRGVIEVRQLDLSRLASVRRFAQDWTGPVDVLINNAGISLMPLQYTEDGFELQMATNYFGTFALTQALLPHLTDRVVSLSSQLHRTSRLRIDDLNYATHRYSPAAAYADSKLAVVLFANELQRRLSNAGSGVRSITAHPGIARTALVAHDPSIFGRVNSLGPLLNDVEHGALPTLFAATQDVPGGSYVGPDGLGGIKGFPVIGRASAAARDAGGAKVLWEETASLVSGVMPAA